MSVVNRMLQDIDRRRSSAGFDARPNLDIRSVAPGAERSRRLPLSQRKRGGKLTAILLVIVGAMVALFVWREWQMRTVPAVPAPLTVAMSQPSTTTAATTPLVPLPPPAVVEPVVAASLVSAPAMAVVQPASPNVTKATLPTAETLKLSMKLSALVADAPPVMTAVKNKPPVVTAVPAPAPAPATITTTPNSTPSSTPLRQVAADETVRVARGLWNEGSRSAAMETLREALASAEAARNTRAMAPLVRELARLQVADNHAQTGLDLLKRLENLLIDDADAWALRGNAEQRLALHNEAAESYLAALRLRPTEGKWMIGAAISLAASGRQDDARVWVERARERGAVTPTIAAYLQQLGIAARQ